eukprot:CAMPEP_0197826324 /NCGR_PEP_ID=MMETSP1437-20131217/3303_1 /TAXON_ID=49252 ORGANISM="Eucampia antarctica, Strain CCMP1452" /NCGR_SAMPLE_ID=MMETSP1437 /ASSEMBLY_ACC=CAM_ASM_001096 /LENGTH=232 /DNA_ID=CAMNT_0043426717 /DNA_START=66 /DNA_END=764 /DNA_ORIENTATION=+
MPHSYSGKKRVKRPDFRPNGKQRRKDNQATAAATPVEELIITRVHSSQRKERPVTGVFKKKRSDPDTVRTRALQKLLRQIASLAESHQSGGTPLNDAQLHKLGRFDAVVAELEELLGSDSEDEDEIDEEDDESEDEIDEEDEESEDEIDEEAASAASLLDEVKAKKKPKLNHKEKQDDQSKKIKRTQPPPLAVKKTKKPKLNPQRNQHQSKKSKRVDLGPRPDKKSQRRRIK